MASGVRVTKLPDMREGSCVTPGFLRNSTALSTGSSVTLGVTSDPRRCGWPFIR